MKQEIGSLLHLYIEEIEPLFPTEAHQFLIVGAAKAINDADSRNWIPVIVKQTGAESFQAIANIFVLAAAQEAGLDKVWCIVADESNSVQECSQLLSQEIAPKINLATATRDEIKLGLDYLINRSNNPLPGVKVATALDKIDKPERKYWGEVLKEVTTLKCGITAGKKLNIFKEIFYSIPEVYPQIERINLTTATREEIKLGLEYLINRPNNPLDKVILENALDKIDKSERKYWGEALKEIPALKCGVTAGKKLDIFKEIFYTVPEPLPPNSLNSLSKLSVAELKAKAEEKGIPDYQKLKKAELITLLSQDE